MFETTRISLLRLIIFEVVCGVNPIESLSLVLNKWMEHGNTWKNGDLRRCPTKKNKRCTKKVHLGLQLDMASQRCLVADCGICVATSALAPLASRRGKNWKSECRPDMIRMVENHRFPMFFFGPLKSKIKSPRRRNANFHSWVTRLPIEMNVHVATFFDDSCKYQHFFLTLKNQNFKFVTLTRAPSQPVALLDPIFRPNKTVAMRFKFHPVCRFIPFYTQFHKLDNGD